MTYQRERLGELDGILVTADEADVDHRHDHTIVLCHGFGAGGDDLVGLADQLYNVKPEWKGRVAFAFPAAPIILQEFGVYESRAWWPLNVERLMEAIDAKDFSELREQTPPGMLEARDLLKDFVAAVQERFQIESSKLILGGFSQGAMLTTELALAQDVVPAALCIFSGTLLCESRWTEMADRQNSMTVMQSHGTTDPILPYEGAEALRDLLQTHQHDVDFVSFDGDHTIPAPAIMKMIETCDKSLS